MFHLHPINHAIQPLKTTVHQLLQESDKNPEQFANMTPNDYKDLVGGHYLDIFDLRMALSNRMTPDMSPKEIQQVHNLDKGLTMVAEMKKIEEEVYYAQWEASQNQRQRNREQRERLQNMGALFQPL